MTDNYLEVNAWDTYFAPGEMAERSNAAVLKTVEPQGSGGSNPSSSARPPKPLAKADTVSSKRIKTSNS